MDGEERERWKMERKRKGKGKGMGERGGERGGEGDPFSDRDRVEWREGGREGGGGRERAFQRGQKGKSLRFNGIKTAQFLEGLPALIAADGSSLGNGYQLCGGFFFLDDQGNPCPLRTPAACLCLPACLWRATGAGDFFTRWSSEEETSCAII